MLATSGEGDAGREAETTFPMGFEAPSNDGRVGGREAERGFEMELNAAVKAYVFAAPVVPGKEEAWRRFLQEAAESRTEYGRLRGRLGVRRELVWLVPSARAYTTVAYLEIDGDLDEVVRRLADSEEAFDLRLRREIAECHGRIGPTKSRTIPGLDPVFSWT